MNIPLAVQQGVMILVVDRDDAAASWLKSTLEADGHSVVTEASPHAALELVAQRELDIVIADAASDGVAFYERLIETRPATPLVVASTSGTPEAAVQAMRAGACDFIAKPFDADVLRRAIAHAARKRAVLCELQRIEQRSRNGATSAIVGSSAAMQRVRSLVGRIASSDASVLVRGDTGTGKEVVARALHQSSGVRGPFVALNCAAMPHSLLESELFGHARGAFTDARTQRDGLFVEANHGTIFLDEIGDLPLDLQPKLLRALQERKIRPIGSNTEVPFNARLVTATHRTLEDEVRAKRFREDLFYRINVITIDVPPLRKRGTDIIELASHFLTQSGARNAVEPLKLSPAAAEQLLAYPWPGNVRELENCMERAVVLARLDEIAVHDLPERVRTYRREPIAFAADDAAEVVTVAELERRHVLRVLTLVGGNKVRAAQVLGLDRKTLYRKLQRWRHVAG